MKGFDWSIARSAHPDELGLTRRSLTTASFAAFVTVSLSAEMTSARPMRRMAARDWIDRQDELARNLRTGSLSALNWMKEVERLADEIDVAQLMAEVHLGNLGRPTRSTGNDPVKRFVQFIDDHGEPRRLGYGAALFDFEPQNVITPHAHRHMVSAHMVVDGKLRIRNFDRIRAEEAGIVIRPTRDFVASAGSLSAMSSERDNIHWFVPQNGPARTFDIIISGLDAGKPDHVVQTIDPLDGHRLADGSILAPTVSFEASAAKYRANL